MVVSVLLLACLACPSFLGYIGGEAGCKGVAELHIPIIPSF